MVESNMDVYLSFPTNNDTKKELITKGCDLCCFGELCTQIIKAHEGFLTSEQAKNDQYFRCPIVNRC